MPLKSPNAAPLFNVKMIAGKSVRLEIYDEIGPSWWGMIDAKSVSNALKQAGDVHSIEVRINSPGGSAFEGLAIHNILKEHPAQVDVVVDGIAASAASLVAMAGNTVRIPRNALMMIHDPVTITYGGTEEHQASIAMIEKTKVASAETYAARSGKSVAEIAQMMKEETWFTGEEAVAAGFADTTANEVPVPESQEPAATAHMFKRAPNTAASLYSVAMRAGTCPKGDDMNLVEMTAERDRLANRVKELEGQTVTMKDESAASLKTAVSAERNRATDIFAVCSKANQPATMAIDFIKDGTPLADVQNRLFDVLCTSAKPIPGSTGTEPTAKDENSKYKAEWSAMDAKARTSFADETDYIKMRRIDDGLERLIPGKK